MRVTRTLAAFCLGLLFVMLPSLCWAQTATITGTAQDRSGAVIVGAKVTATELATGIKHTTVSNASGAYALVKLPPGKYDVTLEKAGFRIAKFTGVTLTVDQTLTLNATLEVGAVAQTVEVAGEKIAPIDLQNGTISNVVDQRTVSDLPLITRDPYQLVLLGPGTIQSNTRLGGFAINGTSEINNNFMLDGVDNNDTSVPGIPGGITSINPDATQEFRVITNNFAAQYGRDTGAIIDVVTKSGSNAFHGTGYWYGRYAAMGATDFFTNKAGLPKDPYVRNQFGASVGGPIIRNKTFWFLNYDAARYRTTVTNASIVPTEAFKTGIFTFQGTPIDISTPSSNNNAFGLPLDPTIQGILAKYPKPNGGPVDDIRGFLFFPSSSQTQSDNFTVRIDHQLTPNNSFSARYIFNRFQDPNPFHTDFLPGGLDATATFQRTQNWAFSLTSTLGSNMVNELRFGANRTNLQFNCGGTSTFDSFGFKDQFGRGTDFILPSIAGFGCLTLVSNGQARFTGTYQTLDNLTWVRGRHELKFGGEFRDVYENSFNDFFSRNEFDFPILTDFNVPVLSNVPESLLNNAVLENMSSMLLGLVATQFQGQFFNAAGQRAGDDLRGFRQREFAAFIQDSWKALPNLTFTYGLRWEFYGVPFEVNNNFSNLYTDASGFAPFTFTIIGPGRGGQLYRDDLRGFEPRFGFAWDPFKTGKTSIRGGFGIFRDRTYGNLFGNSRGNPPFEQDFFAFQGDLLSNLGAAPTQVPSATVVDGTGITPVIFDPNYHVPYSENWNFGIQRELPDNMVLEVNYVGVKGTRLRRDVDGNPPQPALVAALEAFCVPGNPDNTGFNDPASATFGTSAGQCNQGTLQSTNLWFGAEFGRLPFDAVNNNAFFQAILNKSIANSIYHGMQVNLRKRMSHGIQFQLAYTYSHAFDNASDPINPAEGNRGFPRNSFNLAPERGSSDFDIRHRASINFIYEPNLGRGRGYLNHGALGRVFEGWAMSGIISYQTGLPYDIFGNRDNQHTGLSDRAFLSDPSKLQPPAGHDKTLTGLNIAAFSLAPFGQASNLHRNQFHGPGGSVWNYRIWKDTPITERFKFQLGFEFYNIFNHVRFDQPGNNIADPHGFGVSTSQLGQPDGTTGARQIQIWSRLSF
jgi:Carboxypeptidase regulatory-like domain